MGRHGRMGWGVGLEWERVKRDTDGKVWKKNKEGKGEGLKESVRSWEGYICGFCN